MSNKEWAKYWWNWGKNNLGYAKTPCGKGSTVGATKHVRPFIESIIANYNIGSISDAPCGEFGLWMKDVNLSGVDYTGYDINGDIIAKNQGEFPSRKFQEFSITDNVLPKTDLIICRDCLFHLTNDDVARTLANFKASGSKYLLATNHNGIKVNEEIPELAKHGRHYGYRDLNIMIGPFDFHKPIDYIDEPEWKRNVCLWELQ